MEQDAFFLRGTPVWAKGETETLNYHLILRTTIPNLSGCDLHITAASFYRLYVNGSFVAFGPARTAKGYARVDIIPLNVYHRPGGNEIIIEVAGYACASLSTVRQPSFVVAEIHRGQELICAADTDFVAYHSCRQIQKTERYSYQRHFNEVWDEREPNPFAVRFQVELVPVDNGVIFLPRHAPYPDYHPIEAEHCRFFGSFHFDETLPYKKNRYSADLDGAWWPHGGYPEEDVTYLPHRFVERQSMARTTQDIPFPVTVHAGEYALFDLGAVQAGFLTWTLHASEGSDLVLAFSEMCYECEFEFTKMNAQNVIEQLLPAGKDVSFCSFEPYAARFLCFYVKSGCVTLAQVGVRTYEHPREGLLSFHTEDTALNSVYQAAVNTFVHNAVDLYMDCPSRERAGWLCDSYFTAQAEYALFGESIIEEAFLENYRLYEGDGSFPEGALPMCYPSDPENSHKFIPQWDLWYILEVADYLTHRNPSANRELFRKSIYGVLNFLRPYLNNDGLLERLPSWNFVEWSTANDWTWDVNYPTNFLYAEALARTAQLYGDTDLALQAQHVRTTAIAQSFDGEAFADHALRDEQGTLHRQPHYSEAGQYYAALFGGIDLTQPAYQPLLAHIRTHFQHFDPSRREFVPVNAFIGMYLRIELLMKMKEKALLSDDLKDFFAHMVQDTGTLWEHKHHAGSYDHGFASYAALAVRYVTDSSSHP